MNSNGVLIAGIGSGSLGLELLKCLLPDESLRIYGADTNPKASGHSNRSFRETFVTRGDTDVSYISDIISLCQRNDIQFVVPGAEVTNRMISMHQESIRNHGIIPLVNSTAVYGLCSDKVACLDFLRSRGLPSAETVEVPAGKDLSFDAFPCVVKPVRDSGASNLVFLAEDHAEAAFFVDYIGRRGSQACVQEFIIGEEFTVGVMSDPSGKLLSSVALRRDLSSKLSRSLKYGDRIISSGWSQGDIDIYSDVCRQSEAMAQELGSVWALNVQGRLKDGIFYPFEINPRHSGTSHFRALSGVNEILIGIYSILGKPYPRAPLKPAFYYRVLEEKHVFKAGSST